MKQAVESFIDSMTMYRLTLYGLYLITATALVLSLIGQLAFSPLELIISLIILVSVSYVATRIFAWVFSSAYNPESWQITAFILFYLIFPQTDIKGYLLTALVALLAVASKYLLAIRGRHIFNPAAVAVVISSTLGLLGATWWIATIVMLPVTVLVGLLIVWKLRHFMMVGIYMCVSVGLAGVIAFASGFDVGDAIKAAVLSSPIIFAGAIMLTEPLTSPTTRRAQIIYASIVGVLGGLQLGWLSKPDVALLVGNAFTFLIGQRRSIRLQLVSIQETTPTIYSVVLKPVHPIRFKAGQYIELTLPHAHSDERGIRRTFSIASRPGDEHITLGLVTADPSSTFKAALLQMKPGQEIRATHIGGNFVLLHDTQRPIVMIAGGIGITPFRAMIDDLLARHETRPITLFYAVRRQDLLVYGRVLNEARTRLGIKVIPVVADPTDNWQGQRGYVTVDMIRQYVNQLHDATFYISGPNKMVLAFRRQLTAAGVSRMRIKSDYFSGY